MGRARAGQVVQGWSDHRGGAAAGKCDPRATTTPASRNASPALRREEGRDEYGDEWDGFIDERVVTPPTLYSEVS